MFRKDSFVTGEYYHLYNRGVDKRIIFKNLRDYERFMMLLYVANSNSERSLRLDNLINHSNKSFEEIMVLERGQPIVSIGAWSLMTNHFHIVVRQEVDGGITKFMRKLGTGYSMFFNIKYQRSGALFGGLFKSKLIGNDDNYMRQLFAYIHLNPLDIKFSGWENRVKNHEGFILSDDMKTFLESYPYSSYLDYIRKDTENPRIERNMIKLENFPDYFEEAKSFENFIDNYLLSDHDQ